jgi:hypothetical protein
MRTEAIDARRLVSSSDRQVAKLGERSRRIRKMEQACCSNRGTTEGRRYQGKECVSERQVCSMGFYSVLVKPDDPYILAGYSVESLGLSMAGFRSTRATPGGDLGPHGLAGSLRYTPVTRSRFGCDRDGEAPSTACGNASSCTAALRP